MRPMWEREPFLIVNATMIILWLLASLETGFSIGASILWGVVIVSTLMTLLARRRVMPVQQGKAAMFHYPGGKHRIGRRLDPPRRAAVLTGPITGNVTLRDGTVVDVSPPAIMVDDGQADEIADLIGQRYEAEGHPDLPDRAFHHDRESGGRPNWITMTDSARRRHDANGVETVSSASLSATGVSSLSAFGLTTAQLGGYLTSRAGCRHDGDGHRQEVDLADGRRVAWFCTNCDQSGRYPWRDDA